MTPSDEWVCSYRCLPQCPNCAVPQRLLKDPDSRNWRGYCKQSGRRYRCRHIGKWTYAQREDLETRRPTKGDHKPDDAAYYDDDFETIVFVTGNEVLDEVELLEDDEPAEDPPRLPPAPTGQRRFPGNLSNLRRCPACTFTARARNYTYGWCKMRGRAFRCSRQLP